MKKSKNKVFYEQPVFIGVLVFGIFLVITQFLSFQKYLLNISNEKQEAQAELMRITDQLQSTINSALTATTTLAFIVENYGVPEDFSEIGQRLLENNENIDAVQLVQNGVITHIHPHNDLLIGYNIMEDESRNKELKRAIELKKLHFGGPFELRQGGIGIVGRYPIENSNKYNFAAVVIELPTLLKSAGIESKESNVYNYQLSKINPNTGAEEFFLPIIEETSLNEGMTVKIPEGEWKLYASLKETKRWDGVYELVILGSLLSLVGGYLFWFISRQPAILRAKVLEKTKIIQTNEQRYRALVENSKDAVGVLDARGNFLYSSPSVISILGFNQQEIKNNNFLNLVHNDDLPNIKEDVKYLLDNAGVTIAGHIFRIKHENGSWRWIESSMTNLLNDAAVNGIVINFRDITAKKHAETQKEFEKRDKEALINTTNDLIWSIDKNKHLIAGNRAFYESAKKMNGKDIKVGDPIIDEGLKKEIAEKWDKLFDRALKGEQYTIETIIPENNDLPEIYLETSFNPIYNDNIVEGIACHSRDITERKKNQELLLDYNEKLQTAQEIAKLGYWELDLKTNKMFWTGEVYKIWEIKDSEFEVSFEYFYSTIHPDDRTLFDQFQKDVFIANGALCFEHRILLDNGKLKWVREHGKLVYDKKGDAVCFEGSVQDITEQKIVEIELKEQIHFIETALENLPIGIAINTIDNEKVTLMNRTFSEIYGWPPEDLNSVESFFEKVYPDPVYRNKIKTQIINDIESGTPSRMNWEGVHITTKKGEKRIVNAKNIPLYKQNLMISTVVDVTEKALAEEELALSNERYEYVTKATFDAIWDWDIVNDKVYWGSGFQTIFGQHLTKENIDTRNKLIHLDDVERVLKSINKAINGNSLNWTEEYRFKKGDGTYAYVKDKGIVLRNVERKATRMIGAIQDITKLHETQQLYQDLFHLSPLPVFVYDINTLRFMDVNDAMIAHYGYSKQEFHKLTIRDIRPPEEIEMLDKKIDLMKKERLRSTKGVYRHKKKNGEIMQMFVQGNYIHYQERECEIIVAQDITEQKIQEETMLNMNEKLRKLSAHLESAREEERIFIAREIHDELGQELTGIKLDASWLKNRTETIMPEGKERMDRMIEGINKTINKVRKIATNLRPGVLDDLGLEAALEWHLGQFEEQTEIKTNLKTNKLKDNYPKNINTAIYRIFQEALTNIMRHAEASEVYVKLYEKNDNLVLEVRDNGIGISDFDKENNSSLGITGMKERVQILNGSISIERPTTGGTVLIVSIPLII